MSKRFTHRIQRCEGNRDAWMLVALRKDGTEIDSYGGFTTAMSIDDLLCHASHLSPGPKDAVELVLFHANKAV